MKKMIAILTMLMFVSQTGTAQSGSVKAAVLEVMQQQEKAWNKGDLPAFMQTYWKSDSLAFVGSHTVTYGWQQTLDNYKKTYKDRDAMGELSFSNIKIDQLSATSCFVLGAWHLKRKAGDLDGHYTLLFKKIEGHWVIVTDHSS